MQISYGPPPARGVTQLMAVGDDYAEGTTDRTVRQGSLLALVAIGVGVVAGSRTVRNLGIGAAVALWGVRYAARRPRTVSVTQPAPAPAGVWR